VNNTGDYLLGANYRTTPMVIGQVATSTLTAAHPIEYRSLTVAQSQVTHFVLSASTTAVPSAVRLVIFDQNGVPVFVLTALSGQTVSGDVYLAGGVNYKAAFCAATADHSPLSPLTYTLRGRSLTDPIDPIPEDPTDPGSGGNGDPVVGDPLPPPPDPDPILDPYVPPPAGLG
jgi:hypothetical protein